MSNRRQWLDLGLAGLPASQAQRVRLFRLAVVVAASFRARLDRELAPAGITTQQAALMQLIEAHDPPPRISDIAGAMGVSHQNVKQLAVALERKGFLAIEVDREDARARRLRTTAKHRRLFRRRNPGDFTRVQHWTSALSDQDVDAVVHLLSKLARALASTD
jgi:DNA-binding MarR family transcriptional regulator